MSFREFDGKQEVRFGNFKKFIPDPGKYEAEILDTMEAKYNEGSGKTSLIVDFKTTVCRSGQSEDNLGVNVKVWFPDGIPVSVRKMKAVIYSVGKAAYFDERYEDVPAIASSEWNAFYKDLQDQLSFRKLEVEIVHNPGTGKDSMGNPKVFANIVSFAPLTSPTKTPVVIGDEDFKWAEEAA